MELIKHRFCLNCLVHQSDKEIKGKTESTSLEIIYDELTHKFEDMDSKSVLDTLFKAISKSPIPAKEGLL